MMRTAAIVLVLAIGLIASAAAWQAFQFVATAPTEDGVEVVVEVAPGMPFARVSGELEHKGIITNAKYFSLFARFMGVTAKIKTGEYRLATDMTPREVLEILTSGRSIQHSLVIPEGHNIFEIRELLNSMWTGKGDEFFKLAMDPQFATKVTGRQMRSMEGYLFPDTYLLTKFTSMKDLISIMYSRFEETIKAISSNPKVKMSLHDQVILASIIEKETGAVEERPIISSVYHNRLRRGMRLQADPTIIYGMMMEKDEPVKNIRKADILRPNPYNTYTVKALPIAPIANPGKESLWSALNPADTKYVFFVSRNDGTHVFSENLKDHNRAVREYQLNRKQRVGKSWRDLNKKRSAK